jgi:hypothetical protein
MMILCIGGEMYNSKRSEAARKANETRKANKLAQQQQEAEQRERRAILLENADEVTKKVLDDLYTPFCVIDDEYETLLAEWEQMKIEEVKDYIRHLLRKEISAALILGYIEENLVPFHLGIFSMVIDPEAILEDVLLEDDNRTVAQINTVNVALEAETNN